MAINYAPVGWDTTKYINPTNMNHMDEGIKAACDKADANESAIADVNNNLLNQAVILWEVSGSAETKQIDLSQYKYALIILTVSGFTTQKMLRPVYVQSFSALGYKTQVGINTPSGYVSVNITYDGTTFAFTSDSTILLDVIGIN